MIIKCIDIEDFLPLLGRSLEVLTIGRCYQVIGEEGIYYEIINNFGNKGNYFKKRFIIYTVNEMLDKLNI